MLRNFSLSLMILSLFACQEENSYRARVSIGQVNGQSRFLIEGAVHEIKGLSGYTYLKEAAKIGANTIRTYDTTGLKAILDSAQDYNLMVVAGIWLPQTKDRWFVENEGEVDKFARGLADLGRKYRKHPALLSWCLGNELYYNDITEFKFASVYQRLVDSLKAGDPDHPVGTAFANFVQRKVLNFDLKTNCLDYYLVNTFSQLKNVDQQERQIKFLLDKPFLIGEFGETGPWESPETSWGAPLELYSYQKAAALKEQFQNLPLENPNYLGALAFYWGWRQEQTHTWYNVFSPQGEINAQYYFLAQQFGQPQTGRPPRIDTLLIDNSGNANSFWFKPGENHSAQVYIDSSQVSEGIRISWNLRAEDWFFLRGDTSPPLEGLIDSTDNPQKINFSCPAKPGAFRLFVKLSDNAGHFATANLPFYVVPE